MARNMLGLPSPGRTDVLVLAAAVVLARCTGSAPRTASPPVPLGADSIRSENQKPGSMDWLLTQVEPVAATTRTDRYQRQRAIEGYVSAASLRAGEVLTAY